jgi:hypothetical protein
MAGHLFVVRSDLRRINCDAWLLPSGFDLHVLPDWLHDAPALPKPPPPERWHRVDCRTMPWTGWPAELPQPWLTNVGSRDRTPEWYVEGAVQFVREATAALRGTQPRAGRSKTLLAVPLVGTRLGGAFHWKGGVASSLVPALQRQVVELDVDVVLVLDDAEKFAACQQIRRASESWTELSDAEKRIADTLADSARESHLALFLGAGVSAGAGLPNWKELLARLTEEADYEAHLREALAQMSLLDQAEILARRFAAKGTTLREKVAQLVNVQHWSLTHSLLAALPCREAVTQNYDQLFEGALEAAGEGASVLPYRPRPRKRWLLKMHGCTSQPEDIVLRRQDYLRYLERRGALAGLVQGLLLTRHLLFVGFSLTDDNFLAIVDDVRRARGPEFLHKLGTALFVKLPEPFREMWEDDVEFVTFDDPRRLEIFLDYVLAQARDVSSHLLDPTFDTLLSGSEVWLKEQLLALDTDASPEVRQTEAWTAVERLLTELGRVKRLP